MSHYTDPYCQLTFWILYLLKYGIRSMIIHGRDRPKYTNSCIPNDMIPVARTSFCMYAYHAAHSFSAKFKCMLYFEISSKLPQYVSGGVAASMEVVNVEFLLGNTCQCLTIHGTLFYEHFEIVAVLQCSVKGCACRCLSGVCSEGRLDCRRKISRKDFLVEIQGRTANDWLRRPWEAGIAVARHPEVLTLVVGRSRAVKEPKSHRSRCRRALKPPQSRATGRFRHDPRPGRAWRERFMRTRKSGLSILGSLVRGTDLEEFTLHVPILTHLSQ